MTKNSEHAEYVRVRQELDKDGYVLRKSRRASNPTLDDQGGYMVVEASGNLCVLGGRYDASLDEVKEWMRA